MSEDDAKKIIAIMLEADGGCCVCARNLITDFVRAFGFDVTAGEMYRARYDEVL